MDVKRIYLYTFVALSIISVIVAGMILSQTNKVDSGKVDSGDMRGHLMVNDRLYWSSAYPPDNAVLESNYTCIGEVTEEVCSTPTANFQAYNISKGAKIYYSPEYPQIVYVDSGKMPHRFATVEASKDYLYYNQVVYASLNSLCGWEYENYKKYYAPAYGDLMAVEHIPADAIYIGNSTFAGYNMFVSEELQTNAYPKSGPVFQDHNNPNMLYVGENHMIYVPVLQ